MSDIGAGFIDGRQSEWRSLIKDSNYGKFFSDCNDIEFLHIGPHRTGATFLQQNIFPFYSNSSKIFSNDVICGKFFDNGLDNVKLVHKLCPQAKIIIILRNQVSMINSSYRTYIKKGGVWSFPKFAQEIINNGKYDYDKLLLEYTNYFGKENCKIFFYEKLVNEPSVFLKEILDYVNVSSGIEHDLGRVKEGPTKYFNLFLRGVNFTTKKLIDLSDIIKKYFFINSEIDNFAKAFRLMCLNYGSGVDDKYIKKMGNLSKMKKQFGYNKPKSKIKQFYRDGNINIGVLFNVEDSLKKYGYY